MIGVTFGFARYGYGLFLPEFRREFGLSVAQVGLIGSAACVGYVVGPLVVGVLVARIGPRPLVVVGGICATVGMAAVAAARDSVTLTVGLIVAGAGSGWVWAPYSDVVDRAVPAGSRDRVMGAIATGTAFAVALAGPMALLAGGAAWRYAWSGFAVAALAATVGNLLVLPGGTHRTPVSGQVPLRIGLFISRAALPLHFTALFYGLSGAVYWSFAVETVTRHAPAGALTVPLFWTTMGLSGTAGVLTGWFVGRYGLRRAHTVVFTGIAAAAVLLAAAPGHTAGVLLSAVLYGCAFMAGSALLAVWSYQVFPEHPSTGFTAAVFFLGIGTFTGPALLGLFAERYGLGAAFLLTAAVAAVPLLAPPPRRRSAREVRVAAGERVVADEVVADKASISG
ncbi:YbfB/YjiJ family MFS transporter [Streptomyces sp. YC537]|uniref:YbfB/YjiJ family MFS transporter n=2 Tax=Streptomyces boluensis TaxID=1775135 RepID=A0A964USN9_9ACTN|nr:YbfB/YjiJ family MFS transporter [Streptomyces boluensis]